MTTAHRPTFDPARGKDAQRGPAYHQRLLPAHKTLKYRQANQGTESETSGRDFRGELMRAERRALAQKQGREYTSDDEEPVAERKAIDDTSAADVSRGSKRPRDISGDGDAAADGSGQGEEYDEDEEESYAAKRARVLAETRDVDASSSSESGSDGDDSDGSEDDDSEDEEAQLMAELAKIKRERAEVAAREAAEKAKLDEEAREKDIALGNPLLNGGLGGAQDYGVKRRWDDDVVFRNQARGADEKGKGKEFVNDLLRSDFHRKFMSRYVR